ncbi:MAG: ferric reductase-like transmembrane domain-containing protein [Planctomycetota bacterium]
MPPIMAIVGDQQVLSNGGAYFLGVVSGVLAYSMICVQFLLGSRLKRMESFFGASTIYRLHRWMALVVACILFTHLGFLTSSRGNWDLLFSPLAVWPIQLGRIGIVAMLITIAYSLGRKWIPINHSDWRFFHGVLAWIILISGFVHSIALGSSFENPVFALVWICYFAIAILAWVHKWRLSRRAGASAKSLVR